MREKDKYKGGNNRQVEKYEKGVLQPKENTYYKYNYEYEERNIKVFDEKARYIIRDRVRIICFSIETCKFIINEF